MTVFERKMSPFVVNCIQSEKALAARLLRGTHTPSRDPDRKNVYEVLGGDESGGKTMQWIRTNCRILLPSSGPGRLTARPSPSTSALTSVFSSPIFSSLSFPHPSPLDRHTRRVPARIYKLVEFTFASVYRTRLSHRLVILTFKCISRFRV